MDKKNPYFSIKWGYKWGYILWNTLVSYRGGEMTELIC